MFLQVFIIQNSGRLETKYFFPSSPPNTAEMRLIFALLQKDDAHGDNILYRLKMVAGEFFGCATFIVFCKLGDIIKCLVSHTDKGHAEENVQ